MLNKVKSLAVGATVMTAQVKHQAVDPRVSAMMDHMSEKKLCAFCGEYKRFTRREMVGSFLSALPPEYHFVNKCRGCKHATLVKPGIDLKEAKK